MAGVPLDSGFQQQLDQMMAAAPGGMGIVSGGRTNAEQAALYAQKGPGLAAAPGTSWHEKGLAADLRFASPQVLDWAHQHAAEYGMYFPMSWEPWHIQPLWTQNRSAGSQPNAGTSTPPPGEPSTSGATGGDWMGQALGGVMSALGAPADSGGFGKIAQALAPSGGGTSAGAPGAAPSGGGGVSDPGGYQMAYHYALAAGASPHEADILAKLAGPESGYNPHAFNGNAATGDKSFGLWQVNMLGPMGPARMQQFGLKSENDLYDPAVNARAAVSILRSQGVGAWANSARKLGLTG